MAGMIVKSPIYGIVLALAVIFLAFIMFPDAIIVKPDTSTGSAPTVPESGRHVSQDLPANQSASNPTNAQSENPNRIGGEPGSFANRLEIHGRVTDENNQPIDGVLISDELHFGSTHSDHDGRYRISIEPAAPKTAVLNFLRSGYRENRIEMTPTDSQEQSEYEIDVTLLQQANSTSLHGRIGNQRGEGIGGHKIVIRAKLGQGDGSNFYGIVSDASGRFEFEGIRSGIAYRLDIEASNLYAGYSIESMTVTKDMPTIAIVLDSLNLVNIEGLIVDTDNAPVANFGINVQNLSLDYPDRRIESDSSGYFSLHRFPAGELKLLTHTPEFFKITGLNIGPDEYQNLTLTVDKGSYFLSGWISDENGAPLAKVRVSIDSEISKDLYRSYSHRSMVTDRSGKFQFSNLGGIEHRISIYASGYDTHVENYRFSSFSDQHNISLSK